MSQDEPDHQGKPDRAPQSSRQARLAKGWKTASANPLVVALVGAVAGGLVVYALSPKNQAAANQAQISAEQQQKVSALEHDASEVTYGIGPVPGARPPTPELIIENRSGGWVRNVVLYVPDPSAVSGQPFYVIPGVAGAEEIGIGRGGPYFSIQLPDLPPCELTVITLFSALPHLRPGSMQNAVLYFTDELGQGWGLNEDGTLTETDGPEVRYMAPPMSPQQSYGGFNWSGSADDAPVNGGCVPAQ